jgi:subtilase family serine protease
MIHSYCCVHGEHLLPLNHDNDVKPLNNINGPYYTPVELATLYGFPNDADGTGQTVGIVQFGGGYTLSDFHAYLTYVGVTKVPTVTDVLVNGGVNDPSQLDESFEVCLDLDVVGAVAPGAAIRIYFAPNTFGNFVAAVQAAVNDNCNIISISWGQTETYWTSTARNALNEVFQDAASKGITVFCAAGDNGASDGKPGLNVDFPGSSPYSVCCGGTKILTSGGVITSETVWGTSTTSATGGGSSVLFTKPSYQNAVPLLSTNSFRGAPDVAANADPTSGYIIRRGPSYYAIGGTSAVAPLLAAFTARVNQKRVALGKPVLGFIHPTFYSAPLSVFQDITLGGNFGYNAAAGWDYTTGLGSPKTALGNYLLYFEEYPVCSFTTNVLSGTVPFAVNCTDTSTGSPTAWAWDFGNGSPSSNLQNPTVLYSVAGTYTLSLTVTNLYGSTTTQKTVTALAPTPTPVSAFTTNKVQRRQRARHAQLRVPTLLLQRRRR